MSPQSQKSHLWLPTRRLSFSQPRCSWPISSHLCHKQCCLVTQLTFYLYQAPREAELESWESQMSNSPAEGEGSCDCFVHRVSYSFCSLCLDGSSRDICSSLLKSHLPVRPPYLRTTTPNLTCCDLLPSSCALFSFSLSLLPSNIYNLPTDFAYFACFFPPQNLSSLRLGYLSFISFLLHW